MAELTSQLLNEPLIDASGRMNPRWYIYFRDANAQIQAAPAAVIPPVELTAQNASISATPLPTDALAPGLYQISWYVRITTVATTSSSLTVTIGWTDGGVACTFSGAAITGNLTSSTQSQILLVRSDQAAPISYSTTYASNAAGEMQYSLVVVLQRVST